MGSLITLGVGRMEIDWGKNHSFRNHSALFTEEDITKIPYYYVTEAGEVYIEEREGLSRKLFSVKKRLDLLGYSLRNIEKMYKDHLHECEIHNFEVNFSFKALSDLLRNIDVNQINTPEFERNYEEYGYDYGEFVQRCIIPEKEIYSKLLSGANGDEAEVNWELEFFFEELDPYIILRLLAENEKCKDLNVYWSYADVVEDGWVKRSEIIKPLSSSQKIVLVTEGSSDTLVLQKSINDLYGDVKDFFSFIDMEKNYPFTGIGNLYNFCCGLVKIGVINQMIIIFDNDAAGSERYEKLMALSPPDNLLFMKLPYCTSFEKMDTIGPQGKFKENINGSAVAIECFLDFKSVEMVPTIRWTTYIDRAQRYQGVLQQKDEYIREFKKADLREGKYDVSKIKFLIDSIIEEWTSR